ncbi:hypothetical protein Cob_v010727 [Colletotrichum orbiculare MAFF 240422]|uniref:Uncharacterized protein n=1 Tax=Colletotrichum orbiculare (strain 104-T / ATCC 96160 / CBS 514.97 / LARS 414 / MAFF 240422) TaxID=1213857 RepID=N4VQF6_COLOR|nr:hypothetical protein Cob_v010727 [Colletotrichum orbiculare MAFF 240422]
MQSVSVIIGLVALAMAAPAPETAGTKVLLVRSLDDLAHIAPGGVVQLKRVKRCEIAAAAPEGAIVNKRENSSAANGPPSDCEDVPTFITNW